MSLYLRWGVSTKYLCIQFNSVEIKKTVKKRIWQISVLKYLKGRPNTLYWFSWKRSKIKRKHFDTNMQSVQEGTCDTTFSSVQFSHSVVSNSLRPHGPQHARPPCPSPTTRTYPNSWPWSQWCHPTISSSVVPFFSNLQSFPASGSSQMSQLFASGGKSIGVSASTSVPPMNIQDQFPLGWMVGSPCCPRYSQESSQHHSSKASILQHSALLVV